MKTNSIFIGDIYVCVKRDEISLFDSQDINANILMGADFIGHIEEKNELYKENAILIKTKKGGFVDFDNMDLNLSFSLATMSNRSVFYPQSYPDCLIMHTWASCIGSLFVDEKTLRPYSEVQTAVDEKISIRKLRKATKKATRVI